jgi:hypothetical protein
MCIYIHSYLRRSVAGEILCLFNIKAGLDPPRDAGVPKLVRMYGKAKFTSTDSSAQT